MSLEEAVPGRDTGRCVITVYNTDSAAILANTAVKLVTSATINQLPGVANVGATAGAVTYVVGVCEEAIATAGTGPCVIHGPAKITAAAVVYVKTAVKAQNGTAGVRGRSATATAGTAGAGVASAKLLGWAITAGSTGATHTVFVNTSMAPVK